MGRIKYLLFTGFAIISVSLFAQPGAQKLNSLEWANFGTGNGQGYVVYTPDQDGEPQYVLLATALGSSGVVNTDDQQITAFQFDPATQQVTLTLEDGGSQSISLSTLVAELDLSGHNLNIEGSNAPPIDLSPYLDNTDNQQLQDFSFDNGILTIQLEDGGSLSVNIQTAETDPIYSSDPASTITNADITNWNTDEVDDADNDPNNETDPIDFTQLGSNIYRADGPEVNDGRNVVFEYYLDTTISAFAFAAGAGTDDQLLTFTNDILTLEDGGQVDLSRYNNSNVECVEVKDVTTGTYTSPIDLPASANKRSVWINGVRCTEEAALTRIQHITINGNNVTFYENLENDSVTFCAN